MINFVTIKDKFSKNPVFRWNMVILAFALAVFLWAYFSPSALSGKFIEEDNFGTVPNDLSMISVSGNSLVSYTSPKPVKILEKRVVITAYSSTPDQTDSSPFITANGTWVYDGVVACNFLPFGTEVRFPEIYGDKVFTVEDRMALHNSHKIDIWMETREDAKEFGVKHLNVEILM